MIHVWAANSENWDLPEGDLVEGAGQAKCILRAGSGVYGLVTTPAYGIPLPHRAYPLVPFGGQVQSKGKVAEPSAGAGLHNALLFTATKTKSQVGLSSEPDPGLHRVGCKVFDGPHPRMSLPGGDAGDLSP